MLTRPFLTDLDSRAEVKGSVDPLGITPLWTRLGRRVIGNLTTVSASVRDFKTLILGFALIEDLHARANADKDVDTLGTFLRWEQLAAYVRLRYNSDKDFRGTTRVQKRLNADATIVPISKEQDCQILGSQKTYGLWGLFTVPARASGLLADDYRLTSETRAFINKKWRRDLGPIWEDLLKLVSRDNRRVNLDQWSRQLKRLSRIWPEYDAPEKSFWDVHLVTGGPKDSTNGRQAVLARFLCDIDSDTELTPSMVRSVVAKASRKDKELAHFLSDIVAAESVLAPARVLFGFLQQRNSQTVERTLGLIQRAWPSRLRTVDLERFETLESIFLDVTRDVNESKAWIELARRLRDGDYPSVVELLLDLNASVMRRRGGAPWIVEELGTFRVRYRDEPEDLPQRNELPELWKNAYFLDALRSVTQQLEAS